MHIPTIGRALAATAGAALLVGVGSAALAAPSDVDVSVDIEPRVPTGTLALTVADGDVALGETGSTEQWRQFTGTLPTVTVTDTRSAEEIAPDAAWAVLGSASALVGADGQPDIAAGHLGWQPRLVQASDAGLVAPGDPVDTILDSGDDAVGLVDREFLVQAQSSAGVVAEGTWSAAADIVLRTPVDIAPGAYAGTITLSLFE